MATFWFVILRDRKAFLVAFLATDPPSPPPRSQVLIPTKETGCKTQPLPKVLEQRRPAERATSSAPSMPPSTAAAHHTWLAQLRNSAIFTLGSFDLSSHMG